MDLPGDSSGGLKHIELLQQHRPMTVYVIPDFEGWDEWGIDGVRMIVGSPRKEKVAPEKLH